MKPIIKTLMFLLLATPAWADRLPTVSQPIGTVERIIVTGFNGTLQIVPTESQTVKVEAARTGSGELSGWGLEVLPKGTDLEIRVKASAEKEGWEKVRNQGDLIPKFEIKITAPERPMEVFWDKGVVFAELWNSNLSVQMTQGQLKFINGSGNLRLQLVNGDVVVEKQKGNVALQTYKGKVKLKENSGSLIVNNHSAVYDVSQQEGPVEFRNHSGASTLSQIHGSAVIKNVSGVMNVSDFQGNFEGDFIRGSLNAKLTSFQNVVVNSDDAAITLDVPAKSGAKVFIRTEKGRLWAPNSLGKTKKGRWTERKGRLRGKGQGNIKIISKYGDIVLK